VKVALAKMASLAKVALSKKVRPAKVALSLLVAGFQARPSPVECERSVEDAKSQLECGD
jgi:hypothetical protein